MVRPLFFGFEMVKETDQHFYIKIGGGEDWHYSVSQCLRMGAYGLENLALIPGSVGAAPVQNIGAYGVELEQLFESLTAWDSHARQTKRFDHAACQFGYRESIFKKSPPGRWVILNVTLKLNKTPQANLSYPALSQALSHEADPTPQHVFEAVCALRESRLPSPEVIPNCGSFFKNPIVEEAHYRKLCQSYPNMPAFAASKPGYKKLAAAWLIDQGGWKGVEREGVGVHQHQALVLINPGRRPVGDVLQLASEIRQSVINTFNVALELEPRCIGFEAPF